MANPGIFPGAAALMPQQRPRLTSDWVPRDYWTQPPNIIPPKPPFEAWVPAREDFAFGDLPRDTSRFQAFQDQFSAIETSQPTPPLRPPLIGIGIPPTRPIDWSLRDYTATVDQFSAVATPLRPPTSPAGSFPQVQPWTNWTLRDYSANQDQFSALIGGRIPSPWIPAAEIFAFGELPRDMTALSMLLVQRSLAVSPPLLRPSVATRIAEYAIRPYDYTAQYLVLTTSAAFAGIPKVPIGSTFIGFSYLARDMTPERLAFTGPSPPPSAPPQIPPSLLPFIEWPGWLAASYQAYQDQFSALGTPPVPVYPKGLLPDFRFEALIREVPRATSQPVFLLIPPPPPRIPPAIPPYWTWRPWSFAEYPMLSDQSSAWIQGIPPLPPFLVQAVTSGDYAGVYRQPGDVFMLLAAKDFSDSSVDYSHGGAATQQFGWMKRVSPATPLFCATEQDQIPNWPIVDPVPPKRFIY